MTKQIWSALWQFQIAITCECIYQRHWDYQDGVDPFWEVSELRSVAITKPIFQLQVRDRLFWDETLRHKTNAA